MTKKRLIRLSALCLVVCLCVSMFACGKQKDDPVVESTGAPEADVTYTVAIATENGVALEAVGVYIYTDATLNELVWFAKTDAEGKMTFTDAASDSYVAVLKDVPAGYLLEESYPITGETTQIKLPMELIEDDALAGVTLKLGDSIFDFTVTTPDGTAYTISELLNDKEAVVLNFWYLECSPCRAEFPYLQEAYEAYSDKIEVLALNPVNQDEAAIADFQKELGLTFPVAMCDPAWADVMQLTAYPTTVVIDRYGVVSLIHTGSITSADTFEDAFAYFTAEDYQQGVVEDIEDLKSEEDEDEDEEEIDFENPTEIGGVTSFQVCVKPGEVVYVDVYKVSKLYMQLKDADAYVIYNSKTYTPSGGVIGLTITSPDVTVPVQLGFGNTGTETKLYTIYFSQLKGSVNNPYSMSLGEFTVEVAAGNDQGVYYTYTAEESGVLTVKCITATSGVPYDVVLYNLTTSGWFNLQGDPKFDENGKPYVTVKVNKGDKVQMIVGSLPDSSGTYPKLTIKLNASLGESQTEDVETVEKITYAVTVTDENRNPISGVRVYVDVNGEQISVITNDKGIAYTKQEAGTYKVTLQLPVGYTARTTEYTLTEKIPTIAVKLDSTTAEQAYYTVKVADESGTPIQGALVSIGSTFGYTDASGILTVSLDKGSYTALISAAGYDSVSAEFPESGILNITLKKSEGTEEPDAESANYTVKVVDYYGAAISGVVVTFTGDNGTAMQPVDSNGTAAVTLKKGTYKISLSFTSGTYEHNADAVTLTEESPDATVTVVAHVQGETGNLYGNPTYYVHEGATYVELQPNITNYFLFMPTVAGTYEITTADPAAQISYWGGSTAFITNQTTSENCVNNVLTLNIKTGNLGGTQVLGVTGADNCILLIKRTGDEQLTPEEAAEWIVYQATTTPTKYTLTPASGQKLVDVDLTGATSTYELVKGADGYYHLKSNGATVYVNLGANARYIKLYDMMVTYGAPLRKYFYEDGTFVKKEDYTECMLSYINMRDETYNVYPLTDDLIYMLQNGGEGMGWWDSTNANYMFGEVANLNTEIAWMFACCYLQ